MAKSLFALHRSVRVRCSASVYLFWELVKSSSGKNLASRVRIEVRGIF
jgi:hypothetical protein